MLENGGFYPIPLLRLGFRPFYLCGALFAVIGLPAWMVVYFGLLQAPVLMPTVLWHAHEMLFGFVGAIITGFLFTAVINWTGRPTGSCRRRFQPIPSPGRSEIRMRLPAT